MKISYLNQRILITGSTRGIGKSLSELFLQSGADVILTGTNNDEVNELNENNDNPNKRYLQLDFNSEPSIETFLDKIGNIGKIDVLINNAGINKLDEFIETDIVNVPDQFRLIYSLNPMVGVIDGFRWAILGGESQIYIPGFILSLVVMIFFMVLGFRKFRKMEKTFADII